MEHRGRGSLDSGKVGLIGIHTTEVANGRRTGGTGSGDAVDAQESRSVLTNGITGRRRGELPVPLGGHQ